MTETELKEKHDKIKKHSETILNNMDVIINESNRVADIAHNSRQIINDLDQEFEKRTKLKGRDIRFLFLSVGLQLTRIMLINFLTSISKAGAGNRKEDFLHKVQGDIFSKMGNGTSGDRPYYCSFNHIIEVQGVPYDATAFLNDKAMELIAKKNKNYSFDVEQYKTEKLTLFKGANHRFATLGHDPILGLFFGTSDIMTNMITCVNKPMLTGNNPIPILTINHVIYTSDYKEPKIGTFGLPHMVISSVTKRIMDEPKALVAALIKQIIHIGTDVYTTAGIQIPGANLLLTNSMVEELTKYIVYAQQAAR